MDGLAALERQGWMRQEIKAGALAGARRTGEDTIE
jgi:hypothetical protein